MNCVSRSVGILSVASVEIRPCSRISRNLISKAISTPIHQSLKTYTRIGTVRREDVFVRANSLAPALQSLGDSLDTKYVCQSLVQDDSIRSMIVFMLKSINWQIV